MPVAGKVFAGVHPVEVPQRGERLALATERARGGTVGEFEEEVIVAGNDGLAAAGAMFVDARIRSLGHGCRLSASCQGEQRKYSTGSPGRRMGRPTLITMGVNAPRN